VTNASNDLTFDSVEPPVDTFTPRLEVFLLRSEKNAALTVSVEIHKGAIFDRLKIKPFLFNNICYFFFKHS
jgi:hypothetical protein